VAAKNNQLTYERRNELKQFLYDRKDWILKISPSSRQLAEEASSHLPFRVTDNNIDRMRQTGVLDFRWGVHVRQKKPPVVHSVDLNDFLEYKSHTNARIAELKDALAKQDELYQSQHAIIMGLKSENERRQRDEIKLAPPIIGPVVDNRFAVARQMNNGGPGSHAQR
jgi:hypothetical protein